MVMYVLSDVPEFMNLLYKSEPCDLLRLNEQDKYSIIRYDKNMLSKSLYSSIGLLRSVIVNSAKEVVSFAPPKSMEASEFILKYPCGKNICCQEFVEGTMINVFWNKMDEWEIATRNVVGANTSFFKNPNAKTFREMFQEALVYCKLDLNDLDKEYCYSFVLQHPENRIVIPFKNPVLYLVSIYRINGLTVEKVDCVGCKWLENGCNIKIPWQENITTYEEMIINYGSMNTPYDVMGVVFYNTETEERTKIRNPVYEQVRELRGNQPKLQYQYLTLRRDGKIPDYLLYYPENKAEFSRFRDQVHLFTNTLYKNYISCFIKKEKPIWEFSDQYRTHLYHIHGIYLHNLKERRLYVNNSVVQNYVNKLHPSLLMHCLNYHMKKRSIDFLHVNLSV